MTHTVSEVCCAPRSPCYSLIASLYSEVPYDYREEVERFQSTLEDLLLEDVSTNPHLLFVEGSSGRLVSSVAPVEEEVYLYLYCVLGVPVSTPVVSVECVLEDGRCVCFARGCCGGDRKKCEGDQSCSQGGEKSTSANEEKNLSANEEKSLSANEEKNPSANEEKNHSQQLKGNNSHQMNDKQPLKAETNDTSHSIAISSDCASLLTTPMKECTLTCNRNSHHSRIR